MACFPPSPHTIPFKPLAAKGRGFFAALILCSSLFFFSSSLVLAGETSREPLDQLLQQVEEKASGTKTVQCSFLQERILTIFSKPVLFRGKMLLSRPDKLRWETIEPIPSALVFSGDMGLRCNDDVPPVRFDLQTDPVMKMVAEQIWTWADGDYERLRNKFNIKLIEEHTIELVPASPTGQVIQSIKVSFGQETLQPITVEVLENGGDSTRIRFSDYHLNQPVADAWFTTCSP